MTITVGRLAFSWIYSRKKSMKDMADLRYLLSFCAQSRIFSHSSAGLRVAAVLLEVENAGLRLAFAH
jgi:hypothetical protein